MTEHDSANLLMFSIQYIMYKKRFQDFQTFLECCYKSNKLRVRIKQETKMKFITFMN